MHDHWYTDGKVPASYDDRGEYRGWWLQQLDAWPHSWCVHDPDGYHIDDGFDSETDATNFIDRQIENQQEAAWEAEEAAREAEEAERKKAA